MLIAEDLLLLLTNDETGKLAVSPGAADERSAARCSSSSP